MFFVGMFLLFVLVPLAELTLLLMIAEASHWWVSLAIVIATGLIGASLARHQGAHAWRRLSVDLRAGKLPTDSGLDAVLILIAGIVLITPGVLTDLAGILLLIPLTRGAARRRIKRWASQRFQVNAQVMRSQVVDSYVVEDEADSDSSGSS
jgi:UPF0716 protein FxsA